VFDYLQFYVFCFFPDTFYVFNSRSSIFLTSREIDFVKSVKEDRFFRRHELIGYSIDAVDNDNNVYVAYLDLIQPVILSGE